MEKLNWKRLGITVGIVLFTAGVVGGSTWYFMDQANREQQKTIDAQNAQLEKLSSIADKEEVKEDDEKAEESEVVSKDTISPTVVVLGTLMRWADAWKFQFSEKMDSSTIKIGNINLYAVGGSVGTQGRKDLNNDILTEFGLNYDQKDNILTIPVKNKDYLSCASCTWEFEFTQNVKDLAGNKLIPKSFPMN